LSLGKCEQSFSTIGDAIMDGLNPWNNDKPYNYGTSWIVSKPYLSQINLRMTGDPDKHWLTFALENYINIGNTKNKSILLLGSNEGWMEIHIRNLGFKGRIVATDIADKALARARKKVLDLGLKDIDHIVADLNKDTFEPESFDYIIAEGVLHHIENIDFCIAQLKYCLKAGGLLIGSEFIGAFRFQFPDVQVRWINAALDMLPRKYRPSKVGGNPNLPYEENEKDKVRYVPMTIEAMLAMDPSEAVSGHLLMEAIGQHFAVEVANNAGGSLIMNMGGQFPFDDTNTDPYCCDWLLSLAEIERILYEQKIVASDLIFFVCRVKK
jgi:ubiquinone/menaquinone biosynthesis C-methylase UbiE